MGQHHPRSGGFANMLVITPQKYPVFTFHLRRSLICVAMMQHHQDTYHVITSAAVTSMWLRMSKSTRRFSQYYVSHTDL